MAKREKRQPGRKTPLPAAEVTKPVTYRLDPTTTGTIRALSEGEAGSCTVAGVSST